MVDNRTREELISENAQLRREVNKAKKVDDCRSCADDVAMLHQSLMSAGFTRDESTKILLALIKTYK